jgi:superfamily I DNA and/or RNA helicase
MFERLRAIYTSEMSHMLTVQYRMHEAIMAFPNGAFYGGKLKAHESVAAHSLNDLEVKVQANEEPWIQKAIGPAPVSLFLDTGNEGVEEQAPRSYSYFNALEATSVFRLTQALLRAGLPAADLGIISPYQEQVRLIKDWFDHPNHPEIKTVDGFQGREKNVILLSFVRSNSHKQLGFLTDYRRLNVAITRARRKLIMIGNSEVLNTNTIYRQLLQQVAIQPLTAASLSA